MVKSAFLPSACFASMVLVAGLDNGFPLDVSRTSHSALKAPPNAAVHAADLFTGAIHAVDSNGTGPGIPRYSTNDDILVYQSVEGDAVNIRQAPLAKDKFTPSGPAAMGGGAAAYGMCFIRMEARPVGGEPVSLTLRAVVRD